MTCDLLQSVKRDRNVLQSTRLPDEEQDGIPFGQAPKLLMHLGTMAEEIVYATLGHNLQEEDDTEMN